MMNEQSRRRFDEMLPWYVNGTLDEPSRKWFEQQLAGDPSLRAEIGWTETLQRQIRESAPAVSAELGLDRLMARIRHERDSALRPDPAARTGSRLGARLGALLEGFRLRPAFAMAAAVVLVQFGVIGALVSEQGRLESEFERFRSISGGQIVTGPALEVVFRSDALEREIRETLVRIGGTLAGGPGQLGVYIVYVPADEIGQARTMLEQNPIVELVSVARSQPSGGS